jgi:Fur family transcriptional regulator, ferric uptake regulator
VIASTQTNEPFSGTSSLQEEPCDPIVDKLRQVELRNTRPRRAIIAALRKQTMPASVEQIHREIGVSNCDLVTVYRTMAMFEEVGLVRRSYRHDGTTTFELGASRPATYRVTCKISDTTEEIEPTIVAELREVIAQAEEKLRQMGYAEVGHFVQFFGVAPTVASRLG